MTSAEHIYRWSYVLQICLLSLVLLLQLFTGLRIKSERFFSISDPKDEYANICEARCGQ